MAENVLKRHISRIIRKICEQNTLRINFFGYFKCIRVCQVWIGRWNGQYQTVLFADELQKHVADQDFDVCRLVTDRYLSHARQVYHRQVQYCNIHQTRCPLLIMAINIDTQKISKTHTSPHGHLETSYFVLTMMDEKNLANKALTQRRNNCF